MLVLSRKIEQSIQIDADVYIKVISIDGGRVKLGISAPDHVRIVRSELLTHQSGDTNCQGCCTFLVR